jgi:hypothetical protein
LICNIQLYKEITMAEPIAATGAISKAFTLFGHICMGSMILSVWDPNLMAWMGNFLSHSVSGYANLPDALGSVFGAAADPSQAVAASVPHHAGAAGISGATQTVGHSGLTTLTPDLSASWMNALSPELQSQFSALGSDVIGKFNGLSAGMQKQFFEQLPIYQDNGLSLSDAINAFCIK